MAIRFDNNTDYLSRTTNVPAGTSFTACGWAQQSVDNNAISVIFALNEAADQYLYTSAADGTTFGIYGRSGGGAAFATSPALGTPFFWAIKRGAATTVTGYWRPRERSTFITVTDTATGSAATASMQIARETLGATSGFNGLIWNVRVWDRVLTDPELLAESNSDEPVSKHGLNSWFRMDHQGDNFDASLYKRHMTKNGTLTTEWPRVIVPARKVFKPKLVVASVAAPAGDAVPQVWAQYRRRAA